MTVTNLAPRPDIGSPGRTVVTAFVPIPVIIVSFRNASDVNTCLRALSRMERTPEWDVFICENGGPEAFDALVATLTGTGGTCLKEEPGERDAPGSTVSFFEISFVRMLRLPLRNGAAGRTVYVHIGEASANLGFAGGVNAYLRPLLGISGWPGAWILNPDAEPAPDALKELVDYADKQRRDMVGSRLVPRGTPDVIQTRGLVWHKWRGATKLLDYSTPTAICPSPAQMDARMDAPSGASMYVTRGCVERIGLMDERYFLYFEDLDWGLRAKRHGTIGYADGSVVVHAGGTTIGSSVSRGHHSQLAIYLDFRNRLLFVQHHCARWLPWTIVMELLELLELVRLRAFRNVLAGARGMGAGLIGISGRPDHMMRMHRTRGQAEAQ